MPRDARVYLRDAKQPSRLLWSSKFEIDRQSTIIRFGDFDNVNRIKMLIITDSASSYALNKEGSEYSVTEIRRYAQGRAVPLLPLDPLKPSRNVKVGRSIYAKDELFFINRVKPFSYGDLFKVFWQEQGIQLVGISFPKSIGFDNLNLADMDSDSVDEIVLSEVRGRVGGREEPAVKNRRDVVHIIRWNGKEYVKMWTSKPLGEITQVLVDDITGDGKKEIIVGNARGEIHIFGQK